MRPYEYLCEGEPCKRLRTDRYGQALNPDAMRLGSDDPGAGKRYHPECWPEHSAEPVSELEADVGSSPHVIVCRWCHKPVRTMEGGRYPIHARVSL